MLRSEGHAKNAAFGLGLGSVLNIALKLECRIMVQQYKVDIICSRLNIVKADFGYPDV